MKPTKKQITDARKVYDLFWDSYMKGDVDTFASTLDDTFEMIGTSESERCHTKADGIEFFKDQAEEVVGKADMRNRQIHAIPVEGMVLVNELCDIYVLAENDWNLYSKIRISTFLRETADGWKVVQQHGSFPDIRVQEGETLAIEKISRENIELRDAVKRRTAELENKNRELEIEASLERVRARSMAMHSSDELNDVLSLLFDQFNILGINPAWAHLSLIDLDKNTFTYRMSRSDKNNHLAGQVVDLDARPEWQSGVEAFKSDNPDPVICLHFQPETLPHVWELFDESLSSIPEETGIRIGDFPNGLYNTQGNCKFGYIGFNHSRPPTEEEKKIVAQFATEFGRLYQRYLDLEKAEAQAKEAQIEAALERIRSASMAMHKTGDISSVVTVFFEQLNELNVHFVQAWIDVFHLDKGYFDIWLSPLEGVYEDPIHFQMPSALFEDTSIKSWQEGKTFSYISFQTRDDVEALFQACDEVTNSTYFKHIQEKLQLERLEFIDANYKYGTVSKSGVVKATKEEEQILHRFAKVFEQTYTRFLDIQKAEAQAREAQIEASLERIRTRTLLMKDSNELNEAVAVFFQEFQQLDLLPTEARTYFCKINKVKRLAEVWMTETDGKVMSGSHYTPLDSSPSLINYYQSWVDGEPYLIRDYTGENLQEYLSFVSSLPHVKTDEDYLKIFSSPPDRIVMTDATFRQGCIGVMTFEPLSDEALDILIRFAKVFEFTYTRFLDLEKAEAQAREAKIEAALERVRASSLAMHESTEMQQVANAIYEQLDELGLHMDAVGMSGQIEAGTDYEVWVGGSEFDLPLQIPYTDSTQVQRDYNAVIKNRPELFTHTYSGKIKKEYIDFLLDQNEFPEALRKKMTDSEAFSTSISFSQNSSIQIATYSDQPYSDEENEILKRFCRVFEQAYVRFMDLKKAEERARVSQIEASLERVRARSMAMQKSDELHDVLSVLFNQFDVLGIRPVNVFLSLFNREERTLTYRATGTGGSRTQGQQVVSLDSLDVWKELFEKWKNDNSDSVEVIYYEKEILPTLFGLLDETFSAMPEEERMTIDQFPEGGYTAHGYTPFGYIGFNHTREPTSEEKDILTKFASEFSRVYQRFLDIEKAEAQSRESEIQLALERVRARTMAMQNSEELAETAAIMFKQMKILGVTPERMNICLVKEDSKELEIWSTDQDGVEINHQFTASFDEPTTGKKAYEAWKKGLKSGAITLTGDDLSSWIRYVREEMNMDIRGERIKDRRIHSFASFSHGLLITTTSEPLPPESIRLMERFAEVFNLTYTRFLDLQKAEEQAREAKIEAALERVRSKSLAMHESSDLHEVVTLVYEQLETIGLFMNSVLLHELVYDSKEQHFWVAANGQVYPEQTVIPLTRNAFFTRFEKARKNGEAFFMQSLSKRQKDSFFDHYFKQSNHSDVPQERKDYIYSCKGLNRSTAIHKYTAMSIARYDNITYSEEENKVIRRFAQVFEQSYQRYLDLKKAEEQTREAEIEASLERVRSKGLAMHNTDDIKSATAIVFNELSRLGIGMERCGITLMNDTPIAELWSTTLSDETKEVMDIVTGFLDFRMHPLTQQSYRDWQEKKEFSIYHLMGEELQKYYDKLEKQPGYRFPKVENYPEQQVLHSFFFTDGAVFVYTTLELSADAKKIVRRFTNVFEQTYTRFLDLQKAENQAREAQIEAALERVRSRSMGMQKSDELRSVVNTLYGEFQQLNVDFHVAAIQLIPDDSMDLHLWLATADGLYDDIIHWPFTDIPIFHQIHKSKSGDKMLEYTMTEAETGEFFNEYFTLEAAPSERKDAIKDVSVIDFAGQHQEHTGIFLMRYTDGSFSSHEKDIIRRFSKVFEQTYTRFLDIQRAERLALETARQSSLDRIRAVIASMRSAEDLQQITPLIWDELKTLEIPFIRCGVFIIDEENGLSHTYLSTSQGEPIAALHLPVKGISLVENLKKSWDNSEIYTVHWEENDFREWTQNLIDRGFIDSRKKYEAGSAPTTLDLHFLPFKHGMLYIGNTEPLSRESLDLGQSMASAFSVAYDRYEDFNNLEQAKLKIEEAFKNLEAAQDQLVQQEKLASLGQLTAGIAHEIKNPLNFVNNFSELSIELVEEAREEVRGEAKRQTSDVKRETRESPFEGGKDGEAGQGDDSEPGNDSNLSTILEILDDIEANLKTIHKHGTRADGIVKSMLEHSRGGSGKKEPTNVNHILREFGNLSYHGMRAGKEPIKVNMVYDLDEAIEEIPLVAEDFSRVIVNLCYNSFDALREKVTADGGPETGEMSLRQPTEGKDGEAVQGDDAKPGYNPRLTIRTRKSANTVTIEIEDNGPGIPADIKDKIMQPFFTTKKGTQGTGLGLSITNDIIKAHGGNMTAANLEKSGARFTINLPAL